jgi:hypothetical protein
MAGVLLADNDVWGGLPMEDIDTEIAAYETMRADLELHHMGEWIVMREGKLVGTYASFENAASDAVSRFGRGPYLIRQIGAPPITLPASVMYNTYHG